MNTLSYPKETKSRKRHRCNFCEYHIQSGETYMRSTHTYDGEIYTWKTHVLCDKIAEKLNMYDDCDEGLTTDGFHECIKNEYHNLDPEGNKIPAKSNFNVYLNFVLYHHLSKTIY